VRQKFSVWVVQPLNDSSPRCLIEVAAGVALSLRRLGHEVAFDPGTGPYISNPLPSGRPIIFNAHRLPDIPLTDEAIIYNAEQVQQDKAWGASSYLRLLRRHFVWDYSQVNIERLQCFGADRMALCRVGYYPELSDVTPASEDYDVLFAGSLNERRRQLLSDIALRRLRVRHIFDVYGAERNKWIARAKVVLNAHFYPNPIWEVFRVSQLLANKKCVVSEDGGCDPELEKLAQETTEYVPYDKIPEACSALVANADRRREVAERGYEVFKKIDQVEEVRLALERSL